MLAAVGYLAFLGLCAEVSLQLFYRATAGDFLFSRADSPIWAADPYSGVFNKPNLALRQRTHEFDATFYTDSQGLRVPAPGASVPLEKPAGGYRILVLGPSFAFGWGVDYEQTFAARLGARLSEAGFAGASGVDVVNAGVNSLPPPPHLEWYRHVGSRYRPDLVIQFIYGSMQFANRTEIDVRVDEAGYLVPRNPDALAQVRRYAKNLATIFYGWVLYARLDAALGSDDGPREVLGAGRELVPASRFDPNADQVQDTLRYYRELASTVRASGSDLLVVYFPLSYAVHREDVSRWRHLGVQDVESQVRFDADFCQYLSGQGIASCLDATPALVRAAAGGRRLYFWLDIHWTPEGNEVLARAVADFLLERRRSQPSGRPEAASPIPSAGPPG